MIKIIYFLISLLTLNIVFANNNFITESNNDLIVKSTNIDTTIDNEIVFLFGVNKLDNSNLELEYFESETNIKSKNFKSSLSFNLTQVGIQRGLKIASLKINILRTDPLTNKSYKLDSVTFKYKFDKYIELTTDTLNSYFTSLINKKQIPSLISKHRISKSNLVQSETDWFNPELNYYKFFSNKDGIIRINQSELIKKNSSLIGISTDEFHIYNRGRKISFYSTSKAIQHDSYFYIVGSHAIGDTSYYDYYNGKEPYYIVHDASEVSKHFELIGNDPIGNKIEKVDYSNHFEKDIIYGNGVAVLETEQSLCENWYWGELRTQNDFNKPWEFYIDFPIFTDSDLSIDYEYASNIFFLPDVVYNKTLTNINTYTNDTINNEGSGVIKSSMFVPNSNLMYGSNYFNFNSYKAVAENQGNKYNGIIGFDYFDVSGKVFPIAIDSYFSFINDNKVSSNVEVSGFEDDFIVSIDTLNNTIQFPNTKSSNIISLDSKGKYSSIFFNKPIYSNYKFGFHIVTNLNTTPINKYFENENDFISYFESLLTYNEIAIIINLENNISDVVKNKLQQRLSSNLISSSNNKFLYTKIGNDKYESNNKAIYNITQNGDYYTASINLPSGIESRKIINSLNSIQDVKLVVAKIKYVEPGSYDAFYLYHPSLENSIDDYVDYLTVATNKNILILDVEQLYDTYGYGIESPHSIKNFLKEAYDNWEVFPEYLTIVGDGTWDPKKQRQGSFVDQLIPTYGIPYSDNFYGMIDGDDLLPELIIGRIPVNNNIDLLNYLDKVRTYYSVELNPWMKSILQLSGGDANQIQSFRNIMNAYNLQFKSSNICPDTILIYKEDVNVVTESKASEIKAEINKGKMWTNFLGHGSPTVIDMSGWEAPNLNNKGKYGVLNTLSCNTSAFAEPWQTNTIGEEFVNIKEKGFIAVIGGTSTTNVQTAAVVASSQFYTLLNEETPERNIGRIFNSYKPRVAESSPHTVHQVVLLGDPLIDLRIAKKPEVIIYRKDINITNEVGSTILNENNKIANVSFKVYNLGIKTEDSVDIRLIHRYNENTDTLVTKIMPLCFDDNISFNLEIQNEIGEHSLDIFADYDSLINDVNYDNNSSNIVFNVFSQGIIPVEPLNNWDVSSENPIFRFVNPTGTEKDYDFLIKDNEGNIIYTSSSPEVNENYIELASTQLVSDSDYKLEYLTTEKNTGITSDVKTIEFHTKLSIDSIVNLKVKASSQKVKVDGLKLEGENLVFDDIDYKAHLSSARGSLTDRRHVDIVTYNLKKKTEKVYRNGLSRGFNLILLPPQIEDTTFIDHQFDTWESINNPDIFYDSRKLNEFLKDTLQSEKYKGFYLLLATCDVPMRAPDIIEENEGSDTLGSSTMIRKALKELGASVADSIQFNSSYVLFTRIGYPESTIDRHNIGDTIQLEENFKRYRKSAKLEILNIGPSKGFRKGNININGENINFTNNFRTQDNEEYRFENTLIFDLKDIDSPSSPYINYSLIIERDSVGSDFKFNNFNLGFVNTPELAIVKSKSFFSDLVYERGVTADFNYQLENISTRVGGDNIDLVFNISNNFETDSIKLNEKRINSNQNIGKNLVLETKNLGTENSLQYLIDPYKKQNELFTFNNIYNDDLNIREDTTKPWLKVCADGKEIVQNDFVSEKPIFSIELYDKSPLEILKDNVIFTRVNRKVMLNSTTDSFNFEIINDGDLKARLTFVTDTILEIGENSLQIIAEDATGNQADTLDLDVFVSDKFEATNIINYPNPFSEETTFKYEYIGKEKQVDILINIFNGIGSKVKKLKTTATFGDNQIIWNGKDDNGNSIASGVYYYRVDILNQYTEPKFGRMIKVR